MSTTSKEQLEESRLEEEAFRISEATNNDGTVDVEVTDVRKNGDEVTVEFETPWLEKKEETMAWPKVVDNSYKIVRICEGSLGSFSAVGQLEGTTVIADPENWEIIAQSEDSTDFELIISHLKFFLKAVSLFGYLFSIVSVIGLFVLVLAYPFGVTLISIPQGFSVLIGSVVLFVGSVFALDELTKEQT